MKVFIAGASGVLGRATIQQLIAHGHQVVGLVRSNEKARLVEALGAQAALGDIFNRAQIRDLVGDAQAVLHLATAIPARASTRPADWLTNDRLRREGTRNLVEACQGREVRAFIQQSIAYVYGDAHGNWLTEKMSPHPISPTESAVDAEKIVLQAHHLWGLPAVVLRGATFYSAEAWHTRYFIEQLKRRQMPVLGDGSTWWHYIHVDDMAAAVVRATEQAEQVAGEIFFVADDQPFQAGEFLDTLAERLGAARPLRMPLWLARLLVGSLGVNVMSMSARYQTDHIKQRLGWQPRFANYREGFEEVLARLAGEASLRPLEAVRQ